MVRTLVHISNAVTLMDIVHLDKLFRQRITNNTIQNITGILFYKEGTFIQVLEVDSKSSIALDDCINFDSGQNNITKLLDKNIDHRLFSDFKAGYINNYSKMEVLEITLKNNKSAHSRTILTLLRPFLNESYPSKYFDSCQTSLMEAEYI